MENYEEKIKELKGKLKKMTDYKYEKEKYVKKVENLKNENDVLKKKIEEYEDLNKSLQKLLLESKSDEKGKFLLCLLFVISINFIYSFNINYINCLIIKYTCNHS